MSNQAIRITLKAYDQSIDLSAQQILEAIERTGACCRPNSYANK